jgi:hypothetical protein
MLIIALNQSLNEPLTQRTSLSLLCDDRGQPSDAAVSWALVNPEPDCHPVDFSSLVLPLGCGWHSARRSSPGDFQNILRSN